MKRLLCWPIFFWGEFQCKPLSDSLKSWLQSCTLAQQLSNPLFFDESVKKLRKKASDVSSEPYRTPPIRSCFFGKFGALGRFSMAQMTNIK